jgi:hypothetical protein
MFPHWFTEKYRCVAEASLGYALGHFGTWQALFFLENGKTGLGDIHESAGEANVMPCPSPEDC